MRKWRKWNTHTLLVELQNGSDSLENNLEISQKVMHTFTI